MQRNSIATGRALVPATRARKILRIHRAGSSPDHDGLQTHAFPDVTRPQPSAPAPLVVIAMMQIAPAARLRTRWNSHLPHSAQIRARPAPVVTPPGERALRNHAGLVPNEPAPIPPLRFRRDESALYPHSTPIPPRRRRLHHPLDRRLAQPHALE